MKPPTQVTAPGGRLFVFHFARGVVTVFPESSVIESGEAFEMNMHSDTSNVVFEHRYDMDILGCWIATRVENDGIDTDSNNPLGFVKVFPRLNHHLGAYVFSTFSRHHGQANPSFWGDDSILRTANGFQPIWGQVAGHSVAGRWGNPGDRHPKVFASWMAWLHWQMLTSDVEMTMYPINWYNGNIWKYGLT